jgi:D-alanyl-D-alanine dipeptidase
MSSLVKRLPEGLVILLLSLSSFYCSGQTQVNKRNPYNLKLIVSADAYRQQVAKEPQMLMVDLRKSLAGLVFDIRYATKNNFTGTIIYTEPGAFVR